VCISCTNKGLNTINMHGATTKIIKCIFLLFFADSTGIELQSMARYTLPFSCKYSPKYFEKRVVVKPLTRLKENE